MIHSFHIFDKTCEQVYVKHLHPPPSSSSSSSSGHSTLAGADHAKLLFGVLVSLFSITSKLTPDANVIPAAGTIGGTGSLTYRTDAYAVHCRRTPSGLWFVSVSSLATTLPPNLLETVYANLYVPFVVLNPLSVSALYPEDETERLLAARLGPVTPSPMAAADKDSRESRQRERRRRELLRREETLGYGGREHVRGLLMVQGNVLFDAALTQFLGGF